MNNLFNGGGGRMYTFLSFAGRKLYPPPPLLMLEQ